MERIILHGFQKNEIQNISGKGIWFKRVQIPNENCSNFIIRTETVNLKTQDTVRSAIVCNVSPYQRDVSQVVLYQSLVVPDSSKFSINIESVIKPEFNGIATVDYEVFNPTNSQSNVFISEKDRQTAFRVALINLARFFNIPDWENDDNQRLYDRLKEMNPPIFQSLKKYFAAYDEWFNFYANQKDNEIKKGIAMELNAEEKEKLAILINKRTNTLNALQTEFDQLQFDQFKKLNGLENVDGIIL